MVAIPSRHKSLLLFAIVIVAQLLLLAVQIKRDSQGRLIRVWTVGAISPFEKAGASGIGGVRGVWRHYFALRNTSRENEQLRRENDALKLRLDQLQGKATEADRLAALLNFRQSQENVPMIGARVIGAGADAASQTIYLDRGEHDGIKRNMGVITPEGVVGKIIESYPNTSQVLLLTDKDSGVGAMLADSRIQSPVGGTGEPLLTMKYVANDDVVKVGEPVVTSGMDRIFPRDIPVGTIAEVNAGNPFKQIRIRPAANLEKLEEVLVLQSMQPLNLPKAPEANTTNGAAPPAGSAGTANQPAAAAPVGGQSPATAAPAPQNSPAPAQQPPAVHP